MIRQTILFLYFFIACLLTGLSVRADETSDRIDENIRIETAVRLLPEDRFDLYLKMTPLNGWHILAENPGDIGTLLQFEPIYPSADQMKHKASSVPEVFAYENIFGQYGYASTAYFLFEGLLPPDFEQAGIELRLKATACRDECVPFERSVRAWPTRMDLDFRQADATFPIESDDRITAVTDGQKLVLDITSTQANPDLPTGYIPLEKDLFSPIDPIRIQRTANGAIRLMIDTNDREIEGLSPTGILIFKESARLIKAQNSVERRPIDNQPTTTLFAYILTAFVAGLLLNLMPCVFPVLSLKALALSDFKSRIGHIKEAIAYTAGVMVSFLLMAGILYILRQSGQKIGWGFQLQSPIFIAVLLIFFILIFVALTDRLPISGRLASLAYGFKHLGGFGTGFVAVVVATPCTGPFMGAVVGYALMQPPSAGFPIFMSLGFGYALPMALIEIFPQTLKKYLPRPGRWMIVFKKALAVPVLLTCLWLAWILAYQLFPKNVPDSDDEWQPFDQTKIENLIAEGQPVFIDYTAKWCLTCLVNERTIFKTKRFKQNVRDQHINLFKADWTNKDPKISESLTSFGRSGVPLYVYFPPNSHGNAVILPQIPSADDLLPNDKL